MAFVVSRPFHDSNVGSNLSSLAGAAWLARRLERSLVVDWRGLSQLGDPSLNYCTEFFETPETLGGVTVVYAPTDVAGEYEQLLDNGTVSPSTARALATGDATPAAEPIVLQSYHGLD